MQRSPDSRCSVTPSGWRSTLAGAAKSTGAQRLIHTANNAAFVNDIRRVYRCRKGTRTSESTERIWLFCDRFPLRLSLEGCMPVSTFLLNRSHVAYG